MSNPANENNKPLKELLNKQQADDAFEQEALEGFSALGSDEAMKAKERLDARIYPAVFSDQKSRAGYWLAAAGLLLVIGLTVYFISNGSGAPSKDLALSTEQRHEELSPALPEQKIMPAPAKEEKTARPVAEPKPAAAPAKEVATERADKKEINSKLQSAAPAAEPEAAPDVAAVEKEPAPIAMGKKAGQEGAAMDAVQSPPTAFTSQSMDLAKDKEETNTFKPAISAPQPREAGRKSKSPAAAHANILADSAPVYAGGDNALQKDLKEKLAAKQLLHPFEAILYLNSGNRVESVKFENCRDLTAEQQKQITEILKTLDKFSGAEKGAATYKMKFTLSD